MEEISLDDHKTIFMIDANESVIKYYDDIVSDVLGQYFRLKKCENKHMWFGEWENHRRIVIELWAAKGVFYHVHWGYNYDFVARLNRQDKFVYARTDKAVRCDVHDSYENHIAYDDKNLGIWESYDIWRKYELPSYASDVEFAKKYIRQTFSNNIPFMLEWYETHINDDAVIDYIEEQMSDVCLWNWDFTLAFLYARRHQMDKSIATLKKRYFTGDYEIPEKVIDKLKTVELE